VLIIFTSFSLISPAKEEEIEGSFPIEEEKVEEENSCRWESDVGGLRVGADTFGTSTDKGGSLVNSSSFELWLLLEILLELSFNLMIE